MLKILKLGDGFLTQCYDSETNTPTGAYGPIDPTKSKNYEILKKLLTEVAERFPDKYLHLGGDEVPFKCWMSNPNITKFMKENKITNYADLESIWVQEMIKISENLNKQYIVWEEVFNNGVKVRNISASSRKKNKIKDQPKNHRRSLERQ